MLASPGFATTTRGAVILNAISGGAQTAAIDLHNNGSTSLGSVGMGTLAGGVGGGVAGRYPQSNIYDETSRFLNGRALNNADSLNAATSGSSLFRSRAASAVSNSGIGSCTIPNN